MKVSSPLNQNVIAGGVIVLFCILAFASTATLPKVPAMLSQNLPPTFFPRVVLAVLFVLSLGLMATGFRKRREVRPRVGRSVLVTAVIITLSVVLIEYLGMMLTVALLMIGLPLAWGERRIGRIALLAVAVPVAVHVIFAVGLGVRFPVGQLGVIVP